MMRPAPAIGNEPVDHEVIALSGGTVAADPVHELPTHASSDAPDGFGGPVIGPLRLGPRALLIGVFAGAILVALSGALLIGLAAVGLLAAAIAGRELVRRSCGARPNRRSALSIIK